LVSPAGEGWGKREKEKKRKEEGLEESGEAGRRHKVS